jgi:hypothetical protein
MRFLALGAVLAGAWVAVPKPPAEPGSARSLPTAAPPHASVPPATLTQVVQQYCVVCHNDQQKTGNISLQGFDVERAGENAQAAERMIRKLRAGMMPPPGMPRPGGDTLLTLVQTLETVVDRAAANTPSYGSRRFTRLTRAEYGRVIRDLLALEVDAGQWLPPDVLVGNFDNTAVAQTLSPTLLDSFLRAASEVSRMAVGNPNAVSVSHKYLNPMEVSQHAWDQVEGAPFGTRGGMVVNHYFPADGEYVFSMELDFGDRMFEEDIDVSVDGESVSTIMLPHSGASERRGGGGGAMSDVKTKPIFVRAGQHKVSAAFVNLVDGMYEDRFSAPRWSQSGSQGGQYGITGLKHLMTLMVTGPQKVTGVSDTESRAAVFTCHPAAAAEQRACAESILSRLAANAYRRPLTPVDVAGLMKFYDEGAQAEGFEVGVRTGLQAMLSSPEFLFRLEREPDGAPQGGGYRLSELDFATRLSFFLWATAPDQELLEVASSGRLFQDAVLERQVKRMLADPRSGALASRFLHQWLRLQDVGKVWPEAYLFPEFSEQLARAMVQETEMLFGHIVQDDLTPLELFNADYSFLNERLAQHYGIEGVFGDEFRMVKYPNDQRRGIFGHGSVLHLTSMSDRTSPVLRGKWVMEVLMGTPPPPPPPNVPAFEASPAAAGTKRLTTRERMEAHRKSPVCSSCHSFIDPIGLSLDNFDAVGKWRIRENMQPLDTRGMFYDGTPISTPTQLSQVLLKRPVPLMRNFTNNLLSYAIGRPVEYYDQTAVRKIQRGAEANGYRMSSFILGVVKSAPFQMRQTQASNN